MHVVFISSTICTNIRHKTHNRGDISSTLATRPTFFTGLHYVLTKALLLRLILVYSLTSFLNGGLMLSIMLLAQAKEGYDMTPKTVRGIYDLGRSCLPTHMVRGRLTNIKYIRTQ